MLLLLLLLLLLQLSPLGKVFREKLMVVQLVREHSNFYGARMLVTVCKPTEVSSLS
jgi:hypothetical protein